MGALTFADVKGQENVKRALEVAAAGRPQRAILIGPAGSRQDHAGQAHAHHPAAPDPARSPGNHQGAFGELANLLGGHASLVALRPFRSPHHTISDVALVGGGTIPHPGEISLAHNGILFLDELPEFKRTVLEVLRQPLEERRITVSRARVTVDFPSSFLLVASCNPCPCGYYNHPGPGVRLRPRSVGAALPQSDQQVPSWIASTCTSR
jgi:magnesium chelatase family protein